MKSYQNFLRVSSLFEDPGFDPFRFDRVLEGEHDAVDISESKLSSIIRFYESTNEYNRTKIMDLINISKNNITKVYKIVLDYEEHKQQEG